MTMVATTGDFSCSSAHKPTDSSGKLQVVLGYPTVFSRRWVDSGARQWSHNCVMKKVGGQM